MQFIRAWYHLISDETIPFGKYPLRGSWEIPVCITTYPDADALFMATPKKGFLGLYP